MLSGIGFYAPAGFGYSPSLNYRKKTPRTIISAAASLATIKSSFCLGPIRELPQAGLVLKAEDKNRVGHDILLVKGILRNNS